MVVGVEHGEHGEHEHRDADALDPLPGAGDGHPGVRLVGGPVRCRHEPQERLEPGVHVPGGRRAAPGPRSDAEVVEESGDVVGRAEGPGGVGGGAVTAGVGRGDPVGGGEGGYLGVPHAVVEEAAVPQYQGGAGAAGVAVGEVAVASGEETEVRID